MITAICRTGAVRHAEVGLSAESWKAFILDFTGDVDGIVAVAVKAIEDRIRALAGPAPGEAIVPAGAPPSTTSLLADGVALSKQTLSLLDKEVAEPLVQSRRDSYAAVFDGIIDEENGLSEVGHSR
jgi:hypothetical protein